MIVDVDAQQPALLFLADTHYPGWQARLDGRAVPIYRANYLFRAVFVPAGTHTVEFAYRPGSFLVGATISTITVLLVAGALGALLWWGRRM
ncbi:MAG: hypothetical protein CL878_13045 [Dehalococcoidia bacterium]|nr:hypothetical protein [Dehalococcoidia bacterium]